MVIDAAPATDDPSVQAFEAVSKVVTRLVQPAKAPSPSAASSQPLRIGGKRGGTLKRTAKGISIELQNSKFADWVESEADDLIEELHERWKQRSED